METLIEHLKRGARQAALKLTYIGVQSVPVQTLVIHTVHYVPAMDVFPQFQAGGQSYANDVMPDLFAFTVTPDECRRMLEGAAPLPESAGGASLSLTAVVAAGGENAGRQRLYAASTRPALREALRSALDPANGLAATVLDQWAEQAEG